MRIADVMTKRVETIGGAAPAEGAWERMRARRIRHLVVTDGSTVVGIVSERDLGGRNGEDVRKGRTVAQLMTASPVVAAPGETVRRAANLMRGSSVGCLPVVDGDALVGILTVSDVLDLVGRGTERPVERSKRYTLKNRGPRRK